MEHRRVCFCMLSLLPLVQISKLSQANSLLFSKVCCRTPRGVRGLKSPSPAAHPRPSRSHPSRGAWIEINIDGVCLLDGGSHPSRGAWIEITVPRSASSSTSRTPRGVRGLKSFTVGLIWPIAWSHPSRGAWIEIWSTTTSDPIEDSRTPRGVRGLKFVRHLALISGLKSHPSRGAWIEINTILI